MVIGFGSYVCWVLIVLLSCLVVLYGYLDALFGLCVGRF